jgi:hypothetical protein
VKDPLKAKHLQRALESLAEEGVTQVFKPKIGSQWFVGVVGQLQLEVLASRIAAEYGLEVAFEQGMFETARWVTSADPVELKKFLDANQGNLADDRDGSPVFMAKSAWELRYVAERFPKVSFTVWNSNEDTFDEPEFCGNCEFVRVTRKGDRVYRCLGHEKAVSASLPTSFAEDFALPAACERPPVVLRDWRAHARLSVSQPWSRA